MTRFFPPPIVMLPRMGTLIVTVAPSLFMNSHTTPASRARMAMMNIVSKKSSFIVAFFDVFGQCVESESIMTEVVAYRQLRLLIARLTMIVSAVDYRSNITQLSFLKLFSSFYGSGGTAPPWSGPCPRLGRHRLPSTHHTHSRARPAPVGRRSISVQRLQIS